ncbi:MULTISPECIES: helix-turn-helix domain-containing protein [Clostridia]|uniref:AraC family transcriptional regulator n=1 Tax=Clostridia TaxID=186801 RepID=UPI0012B37DA3|nr:helix-turn-helix domain-containing protein [Clostridium sp. WB02_MRS01]MSS09201.1 helix-turn-helix domain-containing protein [Clostridium sp. WB02_MRS01]
MRKELSTGFNERQYMNSGEFEVFFYKDLDLNHVVDHSHSYYEVYFFLNGDVTYDVEGKQYPLQYGDYLLIPPEVKHHPIFHSTGKTYQRIVLWISRNYFETMCSWSEDFSYSFRYVSENNHYHFRRDFVTFQNIQGRLLDLLEEIHGNKAFHKLNSELQIHSFMLLLNRITYDMLHQVPAVYENVLYLNLCDYINNHLEENLSLDHLASFFYASKYHISHVFKDNMGISLHQYILKKRLQASKNGILSGIPFGDLYHQYGFSDYTSFYRAFKKEFGLSPKEFREQAVLPKGY